MPKREGRSKDAVTSELEGLNKAKKASGPQKFNLGDGSGLKRALDESAAAVLQQHGYEEDYTLSNIRIGGGLFTCLLAAVAQFYPKKYPDNFWILLVCVSLYIIASVALSCIFSIAEGDIFYTSKPKNGVSLCLSSQMLRFSDQYILSIGWKSSRWQKQFSSPAVDLNESVTAYFDSEGILVEDKYRAAVEQRLSKLKPQAKKTL